MSFRNKKHASKQKSVGGLAFFLSLHFLGLISLLNLILLPSFLFEEFIIASWIRFTIGVLIGACISYFLIRGHWSVFVHELKHSILANLAGNKAKDMKIRQHSGHFEYSYTTKTAAYNAFISLAPYFLPLFTFISLLIGIIFWHSDHESLVFVAAIGLGMDAVLNSRDISPRQSDFSQIRGGYYVGLAYVIVANLTIWTILAAWVSRGVDGLKFLVYGWWRIGMWAVELMKTS